MEASVTKRNHSFSLESRQRGIVSGVEKVVTCGDAVIVLNLSECALQISGKELKIKKFSVEDGRLEFEGTVEGIKYSGGKIANGGIFKKLFK